MSAKLSERVSSTMSEINWDCVLYNIIVQNANTMLYNTYCDAYNNCFPMKDFSKVIEPTNPGYRTGRKHH